MLFPELSLTGYELTGLPRPAPPQAVQVHGWPNRMQGYGRFRKLAPEPKQPSSPGGLLGGRQTSRPDWPRWLSARTGPCGPSSRLICMELSASCSSPDRDPEWSWLTGGGSRSQSALTLPIPRTLRPRPRPRRTFMQFPPCIPVVRNFVLDFIWVPDQWTTGCLGSWRTWGEKPPLGTSCGLSGTWGPDGASAVQVKGVGTEITVATLERSRLDRYRFTAGE